jgi:hypothetical protein
MNFTHLLNCLFNNEYNLILIDENLSQVLYHNNDHIGEKIGILTLRGMLEPNIMNFFSSNKSNKSNKSKL